MEEIKRLHRVGAWSQLTDRFIPPLHRRLRSSIDDVVWRIRRVVSLCPHARQVVTPVHLGRLFLHHGLASFANGYRVLDT